jgi:hypothetical protein
MASMSQKSTLQFSKDNFKLAVIAGLVALFAAIIWLVYRVETVADRQESATQTESSETTTNSEGSTIIKSGSGGFHVVVPDGWGPLVRPLDSDALFMGGTAQPDVGLGNKTLVQDMPSYGKDGPSVFVVVLLDKGGAAEPRGVASEFIIGKGDEALAGKKYTHTYAQDEFEGLGKLRLQGDRDYEYVFAVKDKELHVYYSVYGSDPRNLVETVDDIVRSITVATNLAPAEL